MPGRKGKEAKKHPGPGRPYSEFKKVRIQLLLDPRYLKDLKAYCRKLNIPLQDYIRIALAAFFPDDYNPMAVIKQKAQRRYIDKFTTEEEGQ